MMNDIVSRRPSVRDFLGRFFRRSERHPRKGSLDVSSSIAPVRERILLIGDSATMLALYTTLTRDHSRTIECHLSKDNANAVDLQLLPSSLPFDHIILDWSAKGSSSCIQTGHDMLLTLRRLPQTWNLSITVIIDGGDLEMDQDWEARTHGATYCFPRTMSTRDLIKWMPGLQVIPASRAS